MRPLAAASAVRSPSSRPRAASRRWLTGLLALLLALQGLEAAVQAFGHAPLRAALLAASRAATAPAGVDAVARSRGVSDARPASVADAGSASVSAPDEPPASRSGFADAGCVVCAVLAQAGNGIARTLEVPPAPVGHSPVQWRAMPGVAVQVLLTHRSRAPPFLQDGIARC